MSGKPWKPSEEQKLSEVYKNTSTAKLCEIFDRSESAIYQAARKLGLKKSPEYISSLMNPEVGEKTRFKKGHSTWNKGAIFKPGGRSIETQFKKGHKPLTQLPVGSKRITKDGYSEIKIKEPNKWMGEHIVLWEKHNQPVPKGHVVVFKNGNKENITIGNLELISRAELMKRNSFHNYPPELKNTIKLVKKLKRSISERQNEKQN